jgi:hypothetical protein
MTARFTLGIEEEFQNVGGSILIAMCKCWSIWAAAIMPGKSGGIDACIHFSTVRCMKQRSEDRDGTAVIPAAR